MKKSTEELNRISEVEFTSLKKTPLTIALDSIRSLNNVGSIFRCADAFAIEEIILGGISPCPPHRDIHKTALGAENTVKWQYQKDLLKYLKNEKTKGIKLLALEQCFGSEAMEDLWPKLISEKSIIIIGNEVKGVDAEIIEICDHYIEIPQYGTKHSLNVSVSAGICMSDFTRFFRKQN